MDPRDREKLVMMGGIAGIIVLVIAILASQALGKRSDLEDEIARKTRTLNEIKKLGGEYLEARSRLKDIESKLSNGDPLLSYVENLSKRAGIADPKLSVLRTTPSDYFEETSVELKIKDITLRQLTTLLNLIENSPRYLRVRSFQLKTPFANPELLEVDMQISAYSKKEPAAPTEEGENQ